MVSPSMTRTQTGSVGQSRDGPISTLRAAREAAIAAKVFGCLGMVRLWERGQSEGKEWGDRRQRFPAT